MNPENASPQSPTPEQQPTATQPVSPQPAHSGSKGLAVTSLVLGIIGFLTGAIGIGIILGLVAVILGVIVLVKHTPGKGMAIAGLVLGAMALLFGPLIIAINIVAFNGIQDRAKDSEYTSLASMLAKNAEAQYLESGTYPTYDQLMASESFTNFDARAKSYIHEGSKSSVSSDAPVAYEHCQAGGGAYYWNSRMNAVEARLFGDPC